MVGLILVSHGRMAAGTLEAARMIVGQQDGVVALALNEGDDVDDLRQHIAAAISEVDRGDGVLVLVDLFGGSPFNASARPAMARERVEVVSGLNVPMLVEVLAQRDGSTLQELVEVARCAGASGIRVLSETMDQQSGESA
jgi:PTS system mannose-specific IIA component